VSERDETRLNDIEQLPLEQRADAFMQLHDELLEELQGGDSAQ
jgi:hypothetical protein